MITDTIEIKASELRSEWGLSPYDPVPVKQLLLKLNILTLFRSLEENLSGMCLKRNDKRFLLINSNPSTNQNSSAGSMETATKVGTSRLSLTMIWNKYFNVRCYSVYPN
jgi:hypothetical protein